jgi:hypothetical protein
MLLKPTVFARGYRESLFVTNSYIIVNIKNKSIEHQLAMSRLIAGYYSCSWL